MFEEIIPSPPSLSLSLHVKWMCRNEKIRYLLVYIQFSNQKLSGACQPDIGLFDVLRINEINNARVIVFILMHSIKPINNLFSCKFDYCLDYRVCLFFIFKIHVEKIRISNSEESKKKEFRKGRRSKTASLFIQKDEIYLHDLHNFESWKNKLFSSKKKELLLSFQVQVNIIQPECRLFWIQHFLFRLVFDFFFLWFSI